MRVYNYNIVYDPLRLVSFKHGSRGCNFVETAEESVVAPSGSVLGLKSRQYVSVHCTSQHRNSHMARVRIWEGRARTASGLAQTQPPCGTCENGATPHTWGGAALPDPGERLPDGSPGEQRSSYLSARLVSLEPGKLYSCMEFVLHGPVAQ